MLSEVKLENMSEDIYAKPDLTKKVRFQKGEKEDRDACDDIDNVKIYDNYWTEESTPRDKPQDNTEDKPQDNTTEDQQQSICLPVWYAMAIRTTQILYLSTITQCRNTLLQEVLYSNFYLSQSTKVLASKCT